MTTDEIIKTLPTLPKTQRAERSNSLDMRLHSGDKVTGEKNFGTSVGGGVDRLLVRNRAFCSSSSNAVGAEPLIHSSGVAGVEVGGISPSV